MYFDKDDIQMLLLYIFPVPLSWLLAFVIQGDFSFSDAIRLPLSIGGTGALVLLCVRLTMRLHRMGEMSLFKPLSKCKMTKTAKTMLAFYLVIIVPTTALNVSVGKYSLAYALSLHAALIPATWVGIRLRNSHDLLSTLVVLDWLGAGMTLHWLFS